MKGFATEGAARPLAASNGDISYVGNREMRDDTRRASQEFRQIDNSRQPKTFQHE